MILMNYFWSLCLISFFLFFFIFSLIFLLMPIKGCSRFTMFKEWICRKTMHNRKQHVSYACNLTCHRLGICNCSVGQVSPTRSRRVTRSGCEDARAQAAWAGRGAAWRWRAWACGPIWCLHSNVWILHKFLDRNKKRRSFYFRFLSKISQFNVRCLICCLETPFSEMKCLSNWIFKAIFVILMNKIWI